MTDQISDGEAVAAPETQERDYASEATKQGWRPKDEWTGAPEHWKDAKTYVEHGDLKSQISKIQREHSAEIEGLKKVNKNTVALLERQYAADLANINAAQKVAAKADDDKEFERLEALKRELVVPDKQAPVDPDTAFKERNEWYQTDRVLTGIAIAESNDLAKAYKAKHGTDMPLQEMMDATEKAVKASPEYKAKYEKKPALAAVDGGSDEPAPSKTDPLAKYSADIRATAKEHMKLYPKFYPTAQDWVKMFEGKK